MILYMHARMQMVTGLLGATAYQFRIRAENRMGKSAWSMPSRLVSGWMYRIMRE